MQSGRHAPAAGVEHRLGAVYLFFSAALPPGILHGRSPFRGNAPAEGCGVKCPDGAGNARPLGCHKGGRKAARFLCVCPPGPAACGGRAGKGALRQDRPLSQVVRVTGGIAERAGVPCPGEGNPAGSGYGYPPVSVRIHPMPTYLQAACVQSRGKSRCWSAPILGRCAKQEASGRRLSLTYVKAGTYRLPLDFGMSNQLSSCLEAPGGVVSYVLHGNCYLNITNRCTLRCSFCPKFNGTWDVQGCAMRLRREPTADEILDAAGDPRRYSEIVFCGLGEPTLRLYTSLEIASRLRARGARVRINTDGLANLVYGRDVTPDLEDNVDALSISLNAQNEILYNRYCRPKLADAYRSLLDFARRACDFVPEVTLTAIDGLPGVDIDACASIAAGIGAKFRRRVLDEVG